MKYQPITAERTAPGEHHCDLTLDECRAKVGTSSVDYGALGRATPEQLTEAMFAICGKREDPAVIRARRELGL